MMTELVEAINKVQSWPGAFALVGVAAAIMVCVWRFLDFLKSQ